MPSLPEMTQGSSIKATLWWALAIIKIAGKWIRHGLLATLGADWHMWALEIPESLSKGMLLTLMGEEAQFEELFPTV